MNILILTAHPKKDSLTQEIRDIVENHLDSKHSLKILDLYQENFDPVLHYEQRRNIKDDISCQSYRQLITWADQLIVIFPIWWGGMPAILKGFFDRVFASGFAYSYKGLRPVGHLKGKKAWIITTHDAPNLFATFFSQDYGRVLQKQILGMTGFKPVKLTSLPYLRRSSQEKIQKQLNKISKLTQRI